MTLDILNNIRYHEFHDKQREEAKALLDKLSPSVRKNYRIVLSNGKVTAVKRERKQ